MNEDFDPNAPIPAVIPAVVLRDDGEPAIVKERLVQSSPVPRWMAVMMLVLALFAAGYIAYQQHQRDKDRADFQSKIDIQVARLDAQQAAADADRERLRQLIIALLAAGDDPAKAKKLLEQFVAEQKRADAQDGHGSVPSPSNPQPSPTPGASPGPQSMPGPRPSNSPSPRPRPTSTRTTSPRPSPTPTYIICIRPPLLPQLCR